MKLLVVFLICLPCRLSAQVFKFKAFAMALETFDGTKYQVKKTDSINLLAILNYNTNKIQIYSVKPIQIDIVRHVSVDTFDTHLKGVDDDGREMDVFIHWFTAKEVFSGATYGAIATIGLARDADILLFYLKHND